MKIIGPSNLDELIKEAELRELIPSVLVEVGGAVVDLCFIAPGRLSVEIEDGIEFYGSYLVPNNYVVMKEEITLHNIMKSLEAISKSSDFTALVRTSAIGLRR